VSSKDGVSALLLSSMEVTACPNQTFNLSLGVDSSRDMHQPLPFRILDVFAMSFTLGDQRETRKAHLNHVCNVNRSTFTLFETV
jgi:hypothetical protein